MEIRSLKKGDLSLVNSLVREMHIEIAMLVNKKLSEDELKKEELDEDELENVLVAVDKEIMGYISFSPKVKRNEWYGKHIYIYEIYVKPQFRGKGVASKLMERVIKKAKELNVNLKADCFVNNEEAKALFKRFGFTPLETFFIKRINDSL